MVLSKGITTFPHFISPMPLDVLVTKRNCASDTPMTSAMRELSVSACFKSATNSELASMVIGESSVPRSRIPYTVNRLSTSTFVWWLKIFSEPLTNSSSDNAIRRSTRGRSTHYKCCHTGKRPFSYRFFTAMRSHRL